MHPSADQQADIAGLAADCYRATDMYRRHALVRLLGAFRQSHRRDNRLISLAFALPLFRDTPALADFRRAQFIPLSRARIA